LVVIWIYIEHKANVAIIEKGKIVNVFVVKYIFLPRKVQMREMWIDIYNDMRIVIVVILWSKECDPVRMIQSTYNVNFFFIGETWYSTNKWLWGFLDKKMSKSMLISKILFIKVLFFQTFCKKSLKLLIIILEHC